jgi:hypothetical protein
MVMTIPFVSYDRTLQQLHFQQRAKEFDCIEHTSVLLVATL